MDLSGKKWGVIMLMGEFHHNIDDKGRLIIPSKFRTDLGDSFVVTRGIDSCLFVYSKQEWDAVTSKLREISFTKKDARNFGRFFLSGATECEFDKQGRIVIPSPLMNYASLSKECVIIGVNDRLEIWDESKWDEFMNNNSENMSDIAENLFETNFNI